MIVSARSAALLIALLTPGLGFAATAGELTVQLEASHARPLSLDRRGGQVLAHGFRAGPYAGSPEQVARSFLDEQAPLLGLQGLSLELAAELPAHGGRIVRLQQSWQGVPVDGAFATVKVADGGTVSMVRASGRADLRVDTQPQVDGQGAVAIALQAVELPMASLHGRPQPELVILPRGGQALLAWRVALSTPAPIRSVLVTVDAHSGAVLSIADRRREASGTVWDQSPLDGDTIDVEIEGLTGAMETMTGARVTVESIAFEGSSQVETQLAVADEQGDFFYEPDEDSVDDAFAEVHTYFHLSTLRSFFVDSLGHEFDSPLYAYVNYREDAGGTYDNAYFSQDMFGNDMLVFGQGSVGDFCYDTDIIAHEHGHAIIEARTAFPQDFIVYDEYGWNNAIGGMHEGVADFWAGSYQGDSLVGEYIPVRDMDNDNTCPADLTGESHDDGEIVGGATWDMVQVVGQEAADVIIYDALGMLSSSPTFAELAEMSVAVAWEMVDEGGLEAADVEQVELIMEERGMLRCGRALDLSIDEPVVFRVNLIMGLTDIPESICDTAREGDFAFTMPFQLAFTTPPASEGPVEALQLDLTMERLYGGAVDEDALQYGFYVRRGELVTFDMESVNTGMGFNLDVPYARDYDLAVDGNPSSIVLDPELIPLDNDTTYYLAMRHMNCTAAKMTITTQVELGELPGDTGDGDPDIDEDGCGCSQGSGPVSGAALLGLLALGAVRRRSRPLRSR